MNLVVCFASAGRVSPDFHFRPKPPFVPDRQIFDSPPVNRQPEAPPRLAIFNSYFFIAHAPGVFGIGAFVGRADRVAVRGVFAGLRDGGSEALAGFVRHDGRAPLQGPHLFAGVQHAAVGGFFLSGPQADAGEQTLPAPPGDVPGQRRRPSGGFDHFVGEPRRNGLFGRQPAAVAVVLGHQGFELLGRASRTGGVDRGDAGVGLVQQIELSGDLRGVSLGRTDRRVNQIEGVRRDFAAPFRGRLRDDRRGRGRVAVAAGGDACRQLPQGVVDQQGVVHVAARRADVDHHFRGFDPGDALQGLAETLVGRHPGFGVVELPLLGDADHPFDVHEAGVVAVGDLNVGLHGKLFFAGSLAGVRNGVGCGWDRCGFAASPLRQEGWADFRGVHPVRVRGVVRLRSARMKDGRRAIRWADG